MNPHIINTPRLQLIAASHKLGEAELVDRREFSRLLDAEIPDNWPPPDNDETTMKWFQDRLNENPANYGWLAWYIILKNDGLGKRMAIGGCGFKGAPDEKGWVETGYGIMESFHLKGYATEALNGLLKWAFGHPETKSIFAETVTGNFASLAVLLKNGFRLVGPGSEEGTIKYEITREEFLL